MNILNHLTYQIKRSLKSKMNKPDKRFNIWIILLPLICYGLGQHKSCGTFLGYKTKRYYAIREYERTGDWRKFEEYKNLNFWNKI